MIKLLRVLGILVVVAGGSTQATASVNFFNGFETDNAGWNVFSGQYDATRVPSGTDGITSKTGGFHAEAAGPLDLDNNGGSAATDWGGYSSVFGGGYTTSLDIFLKFGTTNDTRFEWDSAVSTSSGGFLRDFVFNGGYYNDTDGTGSGDRFVISASNNAGRGGAYPKNPGRDPFTIVSDGWYTFQHKFYDDGGFLAADMSILDSLGNLLHTWTLNTTDAIAGVGGNQYGWIDANEFSFLAIDNSRLTAAGAVPEPSTIIVWSLLGVTFGGASWLRRRKPA